jgi:hypothetical protein
MALKSHKVTDLIKGRYYIITIYLFALYKTEEKYQQQGIIAD